MLLKEKESLQSSVAELREARDVCRSVAEFITGSLDQGNNRKGSSGGSGVAVEDAGSVRGRKREAEKDQDGSAEGLPFEEARQRRQERIRRSPERSKKPYRDVLSH